MATTVLESKRLSSCLERVKAIEETVNDDVWRVKYDLLKRNVYSYKFITVPSNYYGLSLEERAKLLGCGEKQLCKSIIFENTAIDNERVNDFTNSRFYCVIVQYASAVIDSCFTYEFNNLFIVNIVLAKFDAELLKDLIHSLRAPSDKLPRKRFHFQLAKEEDSARLTGYKHNAVSPFGLVEDIPIVICKNCVEMSTPYLYLGGGKVDVKVGLSVHDFVRSTKPIVGVISRARGTNELEDDNFA